jgi:hypothetical protein
MSFFNCLGRAKEPVQVRGALKHFARISFLPLGVLAPHPTPKLEDHPLSAVRDCLFSTFAATLKVWQIRHKLYWFTDNVTKETKENRNLSRTQILIYWDHYVGE